ncbi:transmembrane protease serine 9-like [Achroia grisella]|uniref:transmembrane protease serine 9-like n=1 Tax=Achroia grisella TaxID=688607 RepID=UPI0027D2F8A8|nr:transmembrane protease serine 9-like [Achroia grisella]
MSAYYFLDNSMIFHKNMIIRIFLSLFCVFFIAKADDEIEIKRGIFPFMAYIYYPDETVLDPSGNRFLRGAVLIKPDWLVTSGVSLNSDSREFVGFPNKTMIARLGAVTIDSKFTLNEDEYEQEREVIQIVRPYNHSATQWWRTDITLMKTLLPFNFSSAVSPTNLNFKQINAEKTCIILIYANRDGNWTDDRVLMQLPVDILPPSLENCGTHFSSATMTCAAASDGSKNTNPEFCQGNSGGPLICENGVMGIQTYIGNACKQPYLYQLMSAWKTLITCSTKGKCDEKECTDVCLVNNKDTSEELVISPETTLITISSEPIEEQTVSLKETVSTVQERLMPLIPTKTAMKEVTTVETETQPSSETTIITTMTEDSEKQLWPKEKNTNRRKNINEEDTDKIERKPNVEAQQQDVPKKVRSAAVSNFCYFQTLFSIIITSCFM